jgi:hypothetical protein
MQKTIFFLQFEMCYRGERSVYMHPRAGLNFRHDSLFLSYTISFFVIHILAIACIHDAET